MKYKTHWHFNKLKHKSHEQSVYLSIEEIVELASELRNSHNVIYTYHPNYLKFGARLALWGTDDERVCIDIQYSACAAVKDVSQQELLSYLKDYEYLLKTPESYGFQFEE